MIGDVSDRDQVLKFWNSSRPSIQKELWRNKLNPELSSWRKVVSQAEIIEIAENVVERRDRKSGQTPQISGATSGAGGGSKGKHPQADSSVRAVTFGSHRRSHDKSRKGHNQGTDRGPSRGNTPHSRSGTPAEKGKSKSGSAPPSQNNKSKRTQLSDKEKAEYRAAGRCFACGKEGHMSRNCPDNASVKSQGQGPPGTSTFSVEPVSLEEINSDEHAEVLDSLPLGAMFFGDPERLTSVHPWPLEEWRFHYPYWGEPNVMPRESMGDCYAMIADSILTLEPPFPGDELYRSSDLRPELRFHVYRSTEIGMYILNDRLTGSRVEIAQCLLENPEFDISRWYAEHRARTMGLTVTVRHQRRMGNAMTIVTTKLLIDGIASSYPCTNHGLNPADRFWVRQSEVEKNNYTISDLDVEMDTDIPKRWLENPKFDLVGWYRQHLDQQDRFEQRYYEAHRGLYLRDQRTVETNKPGPSCQDCSPHEFRACASSEPEWDGMPELDSWTLDEPLENYFETPKTVDEPTWDDLPGLDPLSDEEDDGDTGLNGFENLWDTSVKPEEEENGMIERIQKVLTDCQPYPGDGRPVDHSYYPEAQRFIIERQRRGFYCIYDRVQGFETDIHETRVNWWFFSIGQWFAERCAVNSGLYAPWNYSYQWMLARKWEDTIIGLRSEWSNNRKPPKTTIELSGIQVDRNKYPTLQ